MMKSRGNPGGRRLRSPHQTHLAMLTQFIHPLGAYLELASHPRLLGIRLIQNRPH